MVMRDLAYATLGFRQPGTFVEIGALDGHRISNSLLYEKCFGWKGVLIEASSLNYQRLIRRNERNLSHCVHSAVCAGQPRTVLIAKDGLGRVHGQVGMMSRSFVAKFHPKLLRGISSADSSLVERVPCKSMTAILADYSFVNATFLSLDVEGAEAEVLSAVDPTIFQVIMIEWSTNRTHNTEMTTLLERAGMRFHRHWKVGDVSEGAESRVYISPHYAAQLSLRGALPL